MNRVVKKNIRCLQLFQVTLILLFGLIHSVQLFMISHLNKETFSNASVLGKIRGKTPPQPRKISMIKIKGVALN